MTKNITDEELDALLREDAETLSTRTPGRGIDVTDAVMQRVRKMPFILPSGNASLRRRRRAVAAVATVVLLSTTGAGFGHYQAKVADERLASMFSAVYDYHADYGQNASVYATESSIGYLF